MKKTAPGDATVYLDCNATTPIEPTVADAVIRFTVEQFGNAGSRTHELGTLAKRSVQAARDQVAAVVDCDPGEVIFTSGATEANNLAILGLAKHGQNEGLTHVVTTAIEHKAVLEPVEKLAERGFAVTIVEVDENGRVDPSNVVGAVRDDTLAVSVMHANNETGVIQPIEKIADGLAEHRAFLHVDAAQGFGKLIEPLRTKRIDLLSVSAHKVYGPKGVGALIARRRGFDRPPLTPLMFGGGQERGLRPGTLPVPLIAGLGEAAALALRGHQARSDACELFRTELLEALDPLEPQLNGSPEHTMPHTLNVAFAGVDAEALMVALKGFVAISNGSACTSHSYQPSHVLKAMGFDDDRIGRSVRVSWCHLTPSVDWSPIVARIKALMPTQS